MHTNFGGVLRKAEISETFVTREPPHALIFYSVRTLHVESWVPLAIPND